MIHIFGEQWRAALASKRWAWCWAVACGVAVMLAMPPIGWLPMLWLGFGGFVALLLHWQSLEPLGFRRAAILGWAFGMGQFVAGLHWLGEAILVRAEAFWWAWPLAVLGVPAILSVYIAIAVGVWGRYAAPHWPRHKLAVLGAWVVLYAFMEWARSLGAAGFPWNPPGWAYGQHLALAQIAAWIDVEGLTVLALAFGLLPLWWWQARRSALVVSILLLGFAVWGQWRLRTTPAADSNLLVKIVQPNFAQETKWQRDQVPQQFARLMALSQPITPNMILIWPEAALGTFFLEERDMLERLAIAMPPDSWLIVGTLRRMWEFGDSGVHQRFFNSVALIDSDGQLRAHYDKYHLVPFGEYIPILASLPRLAQWLGDRGLQALASLGLGFSTGPGPARLEMAAIGFPQPFICYEIIFPRRTASGKPLWLVNITNDGWFGKSIGPGQHLAAARLRAIETGLPLVRVANTGISAVFDPLGRTLAVLPLGVAGAQVLALPKPLSSS